MKDNNLIDIVNDTSSNLTTDVVEITSDAPELLQESLNENIINPIDSIINDYNCDNLIDSAIQGKTGEALKEYIKAIKNLLKSYVSKLNNYKDICEQALESYQENDTKNINSINETIDKINSKINEINLD